MRYSKSRNAGIGHLNLTLGARNIIWAFLFHFSFVSSASWLVLGGVMSARCQAAIALLRIVFSCDGWLQRAVPISHIRIIHLHEFFFISWAGSHVKDDCYVGRTHHSLQDKLKSIVCSMFTVPNVFGVWHRMYSSIYRVQSSTRRLPIWALFGFMLKRSNPILPFLSESPSVVVYPRFTLGCLRALDWGHYILQNMC